MTNKQEESEDKSWRKQKEEEVLNEYTESSLKQFDANLREEIFNNKQKATLSPFQQELESNQRLSKLKGELLYLVLNNISPIELDWIEKNLDKIPESHQEKLMILIGNIVEKIKR